ncbi:type VII secretion target [uncultured Leifsonia sp.]|uniref:type VII secretion target n=1 Tax=uncultured Leifsonia sp. TaxID=340359 RepID=UPI0025D67F4E|nr:type VII secretion target [uncultured Leifsonia sp.]
MSGTVSVNVEALRAGAHASSRLPEAPRSVTIGLGDLGSARADAAFERYHPTWSSECSSTVRSLEKLSALLVSAADAYEQRDTEAAATFAGGPRAF